jgi:hypothetical protein
MIHSNFLCVVRLLVVVVIFCNRTIVLLVFQGHVIWDTKSTSATKNLFVVQALSINELTYRPPYVPEAETTPEFVITAPSPSSPYLREIMPKKKHYQQQRVSTQIISSKCQCGSLEIQFSASAVTATLSNTNVERDSLVIGETATEIRSSAAADCHCPACRRYHIAAFASYIQVRKQDMTIIDHSDTKTSAESYRDTCSGLFGIPGASSRPVDRVYCKHCSSKMYTEPIHPHSSSDFDTTAEKDNNNNDDNNIILVNMGPLRDYTIPDELSKQWKQQSPTIQHLAASQDSMEERIEKSRFGRIQWKVSETAAWTWALPSYHEEEEEDNDENETSTDENERNNAGTKQSTVFDRDAPMIRQSSDQHILLKGGCTCGSCQFEIQFQSPSELQHCYCRLCRRLSGSAFMTWIPIQLQDFRWITMVPPSANPNDKKKTNSYNKWTQQQQQQNDENNNYDGTHILQRYTNHGQRHVCPDCRGALTIVYDDDADVVVWIAAGTLDSIHLPSTYKALDYYLDRVVHICCQSKQSWYTLPNDGMVRLSGAS